MIARIVTNMHSRGGGELSTAMLGRMLIARGWSVVYHPVLGYDAASYPLPANASVSVPLEQIHQADRPADLLILYANNAVLRLEELRPALETACRSAGRRVCVLNWQIGQAAAEWFAHLWDRVGFLNGSIERRFLAVAPRCLGRTFALAPPVDLAPLLAASPDYAACRLVRHSRCNKYSARTLDLMHRMGQVLGGQWRWRFMGADRLGLNGQNVPAWSLPVEEFLQGASAWWYALPRAGDGEQGPRTVVEAMAAGLPVIADDCDGCRDRLTADTGWLCADDADFIRAAAEIAAGGADLLERMGQAARLRARTEFAPERWLAEMGVSS